MQDPWDIDPLKERKSIIIKKEEKQEPERAFVPSCTVKQAVVEGNFIWPDEAFPPYYNTNTPQRFSIIDVPIIGNFDDVNMEINTIIRAEQEEVVIEKEKIIIGNIDPMEGVWNQAKDLVISFSLIDKMFYKGNEIPHCPAKIYGELIGLKSPPSEVMECGNLFESLLLGCNRDGSQTTSIRRKIVTQKAIKDAIKTGKPIPEPEMRIDEIRIREQAERAKILFFNHKINIAPGVNTQVPVYKIWNGIKIWAHLDLFPTHVIWRGEERLAIIDTKLTAKRAGISVTKYCWATPNEIDFTQALVYRFILSDIDYSINPYLLKLFQGKKLQMPDDLIFLYYVADFRPTKGEDLWSDFFEVELTPTRIKEVQETIRKAHATMEMYKEQGYPANGNIELCAKCVQNYKLGGKCQYAVVNNII